MTPTKPYLIRAIREWAIDNGLTPQILVDADAPDVSVPENFVQEGRIVLNIHHQAVNNLNLGNEEITFSARFGGAPHSIYLTVDAVLAIYARENGQGIFFQGGDEPEPEDPSPDGGGPEEDEPAGGSPPHLKLVR
jgi:stringent starvation protein B